MHTFKIELPTTCTLSVTVYTTVAWRTNGGKRNVLPLRCMFASPSTVAPSLWRATAHVIDSGCTVVEHGDCAICIMQTCMCMHTCQHATGSPGFGKEKHFMHECKGKCACSCMHVLDSWNTRTQPLRVLVKKDTNWLTYVVRHVHRGATVCKQLYTYTRSHQRIHILTCSTHTKQHKYYADPTQIQHIIILCGHCAPLSQGKPIG